MDLLVLESENDGAVVKSGVKGITPVSTVPRHTPQASRPAAHQQSGSDLNLIRTQSSTPSVKSPLGGPPPPMPGLPRASTNGGNQPAGFYSTTVDTSNENVLYPFRVQHLGKTEVYVLYATTSKIRDEWCAKIRQAKTRHAASLFAQNAEPFRLKVLADHYFAYGEAGAPSAQRPAHIIGTPLDRALRDIDRDLGVPSPRPAPGCRATVNCATAFTPPFTGRSMLAVGTDFGVYVTEQSQPRRWVRAITATFVTQIAILEEFNVLLIIADKALIAFHLDAVVPNSATSKEVANKNPQKLSGNKDVGFFAVGRMKDRMLVFYKKRDGISSTFKVLEPVYNKAATMLGMGGSSTRSRFGIRKGATDFFRDFDDFYIASETYAINLFSSSLAIATARGIEVLTLDKKLPFSIPDLRPPEVASIAARVSGQKPLGMFRLTDNEFLLVFEEVGIYVDKHGDVSRAVVMEFVGKAKQASLYGGTYLVLVDSGGGFVEVRNAVNGRLRQVVSGKDVKLLDDGMTGGSAFAGAGGEKSTVKISMMHPDLDKGIVVLEMIVNEGMNE